MTGRIDAHHHIWRIARGDYGWLTPDLAAIYRDFTMEDLEPTLDRHQIQRTILVQAAASEAETEVLLAQAAASARVCGVVGWIDFDADDAERRLEAVAVDPLLVGLRPMVQDLPDDDWLLRRSLSPVFCAMAQMGLAFDALALPRHLSRVTEIAKRHPDVTIVLDHLAKPRIARGELDPWRADLLALAACPNVFCKLSGMATEAAADWTVNDLRPYADHALSCFGADRILWGSDWPVVDLAGGYDRWWTATNALLASLSAEERAAILGGNAARAYLKGRGKTGC